jgi:hypothetical protein
MALSGPAKSEYQREYMRRKRNGSQAKPSVVTCSFCDEPGSSDRLLVGDDENCTICEECITLAVARIAEARGNRRDDERGPECLGDRASPTA